MAIAEVILSVLISKKCNMNQAIITTSYRHVIDASSDSQFDKAIFSASYEEFLLKSQAYNPDYKFRTFTQMKRNDGRANSLHYKCSFAVAGHINALNNLVPALQNENGEFLRFETFKFEVIDTSIDDKSLHKIAIHFISFPMLMLDLLHDKLLLCYVKEKATFSFLSTDRFEETFLLELKPGLSITSYQLLKSADIPVGS